MEKPTTLTPEQKIEKKRLKLKKSDLDSHKERIIRQIIERLKKSAPENLQLIDNTEKTTPKNPSTQTKK